MTRLVITRDSPAGVGGHRDARPRRCRRAAPPRARATGSAPAIASLTRSPSGTGSGLSVQHAGVDPRQLEEVVDHPHHPVDLGADLPVVARRVLGHAVLERLGHRAHAGQRRAQVVGHPGDQLAAGLLQPRLALPGLLEPLAGAGQLGRQRLRARPARGGRRRTTRCVAERPGVLAQRPRPARRSRAPTATATTSATDAGRPRDHERRPRSRGRRGTSPRRPDDAGDDRADGHDHDERELPADRRGAGAATPATSPTTPDRRPRTRPPPGRSGPGRASRRRPPTGSRRPTPSAAAPAASGRARPSRAAGARAPSPSTGRRTTSPTPARSSSSRENAVPGCASRKRSRSNSRAVSASGSPPRYAAWRGLVDDEVAVDQRAAARRGGAGPAQHRVDPQHQLARAERLGDVVVGADLEPDDPVGLLAERGQHDDRHVAAARAAGGRPRGRRCRAASGRARRGRAARRASRSAPSRRRPPRRRRARRRAGRRPPPRARWGRRRRRALGPRSPPARERTSGGARPRRPATSAASTSQPAV